ncbi:MAG: thiamine pyrophosphate-dependent enzyme [Betaproteobacteria bacterium]
MTLTTQPTGASLLIDALLAQGVNTVFCVPGESFLAAMDAMYAHRDAIHLVVCRHEGSAMFMAESHAKATGRPGICFVTRAPGAAQATIGLHTAHQDATPVILFIGQVGRGFMERAAFQEVDYRSMFAPISKWVAQVDDASRMPEMVSHAFHVAMAGRRGPVVLALPEDVLSGPARAPLREVKAAQSVRATPSAPDLAQLMAMVGAAQRPLLIVGGSGWTAQAVQDLRTFVHARSLPVACSFRRQDLFDNDDPHYVGVLGLGADAGLHRAVKEADLLVLLGARMGEVPSAGYTLIDIPQPQQLLVHALPEAQDLGHLYHPDLALLATMPELAQALAALPLDVPLRQRLQPRTQALRQGFEQFTAIPTALAAPEADAPIDLVQTWGLLRAQLPAGVVITNGAGNYTTWAHRYFRYRRLGSQLAPTSGAMGYGLPAAIGAKLAHPQRDVLCLAGDGCFMMSSHEMATAVYLALPIVIVVFDNQMYGTIRMHQEKFFPQRTHGTALHNPDFVALAQAFGAHGLRVTQPNALVEAVLQGFKADRPTLIHVLTDPEQISAGATLSGIRARAQTAAD